MTVAAGLMSMGVVEDRRDGFSGELLFPSSVGEEMVFRVVQCSPNSIYMALCPSNMI